MSPLRAGGRSGAWRCQPRLARCQTAVGFAYHNMPHYEVISGGGTPPPPPMARDQHVPGERMHKQKTNICFDSLTF